MEDSTNMAKFVNRIQMEMNECQEFVFGGKAKNFVFASDRINHCINTAKKQCELALDVAYDEKFSRDILQIFIEMRAIIDSLGCHILRDIDILFQKRMDMIYQEFSSIFWSLRTISYTLSKKEQVAQ